MKKIAIQYIPIGKIHGYENNPRVISDEAVDAVAKSIESYGFKVPVVISSDKKTGGWVLVTGHTRIKAAQKLNFAEIPAVIADDLTEEQQRAFRIADNKVSDLSIFDNKKLLKELKGLENLFTGFKKGSTFADLLNEKSTELDDLNGFVYEASFKSPDKEKIEEITRIWEEMNGQDSSGGDIRQETGNSKEPSD